MAEGVIELIKGTPGADNLGLQHVAFLTTDDATLDDICQGLKDKGYEFTVEPKTAASGDGRLAFFKDKSGAIFELIERHEDIRVPGLRNEYIKEFDHISIRLSDDNYKECADFYLNTLGFTARRILEKPGSAMSYYSFGPDTLETLYAQGRAKDPRPLGHIAFRVGSCFEIKKHLEAHGIACGEPKESGMGGFNILNVPGPDGEVIEFLDRPSLEDYVVGGK
jgi:catechol 2,3-dioxygenase-like lactoylglutathione lyase family enzyme